jgi:hypothetical protein
MHVVIAVGMILRSGTLVEADVRLTPLCGVAKGRVMHNVSPVPARLAWPKDLRR